MELNSISTMAKNLGGVIFKNSPVILTGLATAGVITTAVLAVRATPKALLLIEEELHDRTGDWPHPEARFANLTSREVVRITWRCYIPAIAVGCATIFCIVQSLSINQRRNAALASVYAITEKAFKEYQSKVIETIGQSKELKVRDSISEDRIKANPPSSNEVIFTGKGEILCYDSLTGRYFKSSVEDIKQTINELNRRLMRDMFIELNELYYELGLAGTTLGSMMGWDIAKGLIDINFSTQLSEGNEPCLVLNYLVYPKFFEGMNE